MLDTDTYGWYTDTPLSPVLSTHGIPRPTIPMTSTFLQQSYYPSVIRFRAQRPGFGQPMFVPVSRSGFAAHVMFLEADDDLWANT